MLTKMTSSGPVDLSPQEEAEVLAEWAMRDQSKPLTVADYTAAVQAHLDAAARSRNYDNILSACSYAAIPNLFQQESIAFLEWRSAVWATCYGVMGAVQQSLRPAPTIAELIAELPALVLP